MPLISALRVLHSLVKAVEKAITVRAGGIDCADVGGCRLEKFDEERDDTASLERNVGAAKSVFDGFVVLVARGDYVAEAIVEPIFGRVRARLMTTILAMLGFYFRR